MYKTFLWAWIFLLEWMVWRWCHWKLMKLRNFWTRHTFLLNGVTFITLFRNVHKMFSFFYVISYFFYGAFNNKQSCLSNINEAPLKYSTSFLRIKYSELSPSVQLQLLTKLTYEENHSLFTHEPWKFYSKCVVKISVNNSPKNQFYDIFSLAFIKFTSRLIRLFMASIIINAIG